MHASATFRSFRKLVLIATALLLAACGQGDGPDSIANQPATPLPPGDGDGGFDSGLLVNGDFQAGVEPWFGNAANVVDDSGNLVNFADVGTAGNSFDVNLSQLLTLTEGETYTLTFEARSDRNRTMVVGIGLFDLVNEIFTSVTQTVNLTPDWQTFVLELTATGFGGPDSRVLFDMGADTGQVLIDDVSLFVSGGGGAGAAIDPDATLFSSAGDPELVIPDDYLERTPFGSGSIIDPDYADDETYSPALSVFSGTGYGANIAQIGFIGFPEGFLTRYETVDFKVKGMPGFVILVKLFDGVDAKRLNLTSSAYSAELDGGWFQVSIPLADFAGAGQATGIVLESDDSSATEFRMLLTDIGFSGTGTYVPADPGTIPEVTLYDRDGAPDLEFGVDYSEISTFGSGADLVEDFRGDLDFRPAWSVTTGFGYEIWNAQLAYLGFEPGFAAPYATLDFKVKDLSGDVIRVKFLNDPDPPYVDINVATSEYSTALGNGWYQVSVPITEFEGIATSTDLLFETIAPAPAESFTYLLTDIGFSGDAPADPGTSVDFEGDPGSYSFADFGGGESTVIANPDPSGINTSGQVVQMTRTSESDFGGSTLALPAGVDWSQGEIFRMKVWSQRPVPVLFKVEGTPPAERSGDHDGGSVWQELCFDFTGENAGPPVTGISIFFDLGEVGDVANDPDSWTFYYDDIEQTTEPCPVPPEFVTITFDDPDTTYDLIDFGGTSSTVTNDPAGGTNQVALMVKTAAAEVWAGTTVSTLPGDAVPAIPLDAANTEMSVRVYSPDAGIPVRLKIEDASDAAISVETEASTTVANDWETLVFDFANEVGGTAAFDPAATYDKISIFFNFGTDGATAGEKSYYFDDIAVGPGDGGSGGGELLTNGDFEASDADKAPWINAGGVVTNNYYTADAVDGGNVFDTNLSQVLDITQDAEYVLTFRARASVARDIIAGIGLNVDPFTAVTVTVPLTTEWQTFTYNLTATGFGGADSRVLFDMGTVASTIDIDDVDLALASAPGTNLLANGDFQTSDTDKAPWINAGGVATNNYYTADAVDGGNVFDTNLSQVLDITQDAEYVLTFRARASVARDIIAGIGLNVDPFTAVTVTVPLTTEWQTFTYNLTATGFGGADSRVLFDMGTVASTIDIDDVSLTLADGG